MLVPQSDATWRNSPLTFAQCEACQPLPPWPSSVACSSWTCCDLCRMQLKPSDATKLLVILPKHPDKPHLIVVPSVCTMGWQNLPPTFCHASETVADLANSHSCKPDVAPQRHEAIAEADWFLQSLFGAHPEQKHQFGDVIGLEDNLSLTNEEWVNFQLDKGSLWASRLMPLIWTPRRCMPLASLPMVALKRLSRSTHVIPITLSWLFRDTMAISTLTIRSLTR